jgi:hypothetical protein
MQPCFTSKDGAGGLVQFVWYDYLGTDTDQDSFWVQVAFALLAEQLNAFFLLGFGASMVGVLWPTLPQQPFHPTISKEMKEPSGLSASKLYVSEPGEKKCYFVDTHFAHVASVTKRFVATNDNINCVDEIELTVRRYAGHS